MKSGALQNSRGGAGLCVFFPQVELSRYRRPNDTHGILEHALAVALPIVLADGRVGLCNHWTATEIVVDVHGDGSHAMETERVRFVDVVARGAGLAVSLHNDRRTERV